MAKQPATRTPAPIVAVLNMKGGVGKTTIAGNVFREVFRLFALDTTLVDFDAQFNLTQLLLTRARYEQLQVNKATIFHALDPEPEDSVFAVSAAPGPPIPPLSSVSCEIKALTSSEKRLRLIPGDFRLALMNLREPERLALPRRRFHDFMRICQQQTELVVLDCNPSSSFITRCAVEVATHLLIPVRPDKYSLLGVEMLLKYIEQLRPADPPTFSIVMNGSTSSGDAKAVADLIRNHRDLGPRMLTTNLIHSSLLRAKVDHAGFAVDRPVPYRNTVLTNLRAIAKELVPRIGVKHA